ncbi:hypothetical protein DXG03_007618 [Asterophora parasitica]|uniref:Uncharacterized protein n=1 Tax=Asterophora parasitica TaxID=117018 RepID=A0A9P7G7T0_9AGAR|nr:hypothetical protein DXG03_007618 [Asterophora parasitica]
MTLSIIRPYIWLRPVKPRVEVLSSTVRRLHFDCANPRQNSFVRMSHHPWVDLHKCPTITEPGTKGYSVIISTVEWTPEQIEHVPSPMWILNGALPSPMRIISLFRSVLLVATGPGIIPCIAPVLEQKVPTHLLWATPNPREELGDKLVDKLSGASPSTVIYDTHAHGEPDLIKLTYRMVKMTNAEVVIILSHKALADKVVYGMRSRGISAFGA